MYTRRTVRWSIVFAFAWRSLLFFIGYSGLIVFLHRYAGLDWLELPFPPLSVIGLAVAFYVGFKNNSSYDRLWEARRIWGSLVNSSRTFAVQVIGFLSPVEGVDVPAVRRRLVYRHLAFLNALRVQLRRPTWWEREYKVLREVAEQQSHADTEVMDETLCTFLPRAETEAVVKSHNVATQLLRAQTEDLRALYDQGALLHLHHVEMMETVGELFNQQGAAERIKTFPYPRQYAFFSTVFVWIFILLLPFALIGEFGKMGEAAVWLAVPFHVLISWIFYTMEVVGGSSENPFEGGINDVPLNTICTTIEIDLRETLGETDLPARPVPQNDILM